MRADQIKNDTPIDIARGFAGSDLKVRQIDSSHRCKPVFELSLLFNSWRELIPRDRRSVNNKNLVSQFCNFRPQTAQFSLPVCLDGCVRFVAGILSKREQVDQGNYLNEIGKR